MSATRDWGSLTINSVAYKLETSLTTWHRTSAPMPPANSPGDQHRCGCDDLCPYTDPTTFHGEFRGARQRHQQPDDQFRRRQCRRVAQTGGRQHPHPPSSGLGDRHAAMPMSAHWSAPTGWRDQCLHSHRDRQRHRQQCRWPDDTLLRQRHNAVRAEPDRWRQRVGRRLVGSVEGGSITSGFATGAVSAGAVAFGGGLVAYGRCHITDSMQRCRQRWRRRDGMVPGGVFGSARPGCYATGRERRINDRWLIGAWSGKVADA